MLIVKEGTNGFEGTDEATRKMIIDALEKEGITVRTADQDKTFLAANQQRAIDEAFQKRNQQLEDTIKEMTGVEKASASEKYYDYFKRAIETKTKDLAALQLKVKEYEEKGASGNVLAEEYKKQVQTLQAQLKTAKDEFDDQIKKKGEEIFKAKFQSELGSTVEKLKANLRGDIAPEFLNDIIRAKTYEFESQYVAKDVEGITIFHDKTGNPVMDKKDGKPKTMEQIISEIFGTYIDPKKQQGGAGSGKPGAAGAGGTGGAGGEPKPWKESTRPDTVKSKVDLAKWIATDLKISSDTKDFDEAFTHFSKDASGKELPIKG
jgi:hypothetical protein